MKAIGKLLTSFGGRSRSSSPSVRYNQNADGLPYSFKCISGLKKAIAYLESHLTSSRGLFEQVGKVEEWNTLEELIQKDTVTDSFMQTLSSLHSLAHAIKMILMKYEPLIPSTYYPLFINANENDFDRLIDDIIHVHHGLFDVLMKFLWRLAFQHRALRTDISIIAANLGIYIMRPNNSSVAFAPPLESKEMQERSETFMEILSHFAKRNRQLSHQVAPPLPPKQQQLHGSTTAATQPESNVTVPEPTASIQDRSCKVLFLNPNNRPTQEALKHALSPYGNIINIGFKEKLAVVLFSEVEAALRSALDQDGKALGADFKVKYLGTKTINDLLVPPQPPQHVQVLNAGNQMELNSVDQDVVKTAPVLPAKTDNTANNTATATNNTTVATTGKAPSSQRPSLTTGIAVDESFRIHHDNSNDGSGLMATIDVSHISKADESLHGNHLLDASSMPLNSIKKPKQVKQSESKEKVRYRYATSSDEDDDHHNKDKDKDSQHNTSNSTKDEKSSEEEPKDHWTSAAKSSGNSGWKTATRSMESIQQAVLQEAADLKLDNVSVTSASSGSQHQHHHQDRHQHSSTPSKTLPKHEEKLQIDTDRHHSPTASRPQYDDDQSEVLHSPASVVSEGSFKRRRQIKKIKVGSPSLRNATSFDEGEAAVLRASHHSELSVEDIADPVQEVDGNNYNNHEDDNESSYLEEEMTPTSAAVLRSSGEERSFHDHHNTSAHKHHHHHHHNDEQHHHQEAAKKVERRRPSSSEHSDAAAHQHNHQQPAAAEPQPHKPSPSPFPHERQEYASSQLVPTNNHKHGHHHKHHHHQPKTEEVKPSNNTPTSSNNHNHIHHDDVKQQAEQQQADNKLMKYAVLAEQRQQRQDAVTRDDIIEELSKQEIIRKLHIAEGKCIHFQQKISALETYIQQEEQVFQTSLVHLQIENEALKQEAQSLHDSIQQKTMELMNKNALIASLEASKESLVLSMKQLKDKLQRESYQVIISQQKLIESLESHVQEVNQQKKSLEEELQTMQSLLTTQRQEYLDYKAKMTKQQNLLVFEYEAKQQQPQPGQHKKASSSIYSTEDDEDQQQQSAAPLSPQKVQFAVSSSSGSSPNLSPRMPLSPPRLNKQVPKEDQHGADYDPVYHNHQQHDDKPKRKGDRSTKMSSASPSPSKSPHRKHSAVFSPQKRSPNKHKHHHNNNQQHASSIDQFLEEHKQPDLKTLRTVTKDEVAKFIQSIPGLKEQLQPDSRKEAWTSAPFSYAPEHHSKPSTAPQPSSASSSSTSHHNADRGGYLDIVTNYDGSYSNPYDSSPQHGHHKQASNKPKYSEQVLANVAKGYQHRKQYNFHLQVYGKENQTQPLPGAFGQRNDLTDVKNYLANLQATKQMHNHNSYQHRMTYYNHLRGELGDNQSNAGIGVDRRGIGQTGADTSTTNPFASKVNLSVPVPMDDKRSLSYDAWKQHQEPQHLY